MSDRGKDTDSKEKDPKRWLMEVLETTNVLKRAGDLEDKEVLCLQVGDWGSYGRPGLDIRKAVGSGLVLTYTTGEDKAKGQYTFGGELRKISTILIKKPFLGEQKIYDVNVKPVTQGHYKWPESALVLPSEVEVLQQVSALVQEIGAKGVAEAEIIKLL